MNPLVRSSTFHDQHVVCSATHSSLCNLELHKARDEDKDRCTYVIIDFERKQCATQELNIKHVFLRLFVIFLKDFPELYTTCFVIDFQTVICQRVEDCPNISLTSTDIEFLQSKHSKN